MSTNGPIAASAVASTDTTFDTRGIQRLIRANKQAGAAMSPYTISDASDTYDVYEGELLFTTAKRARYANDALVKTAVNGESYETARKYAALDAERRDDAVYAATAKNTRYFGVAMTSAKANGSGIEDKVTAQLVGTATIERGRSALRHFAPGDRVVMRPPLPGAAGLPSTPGDDVAGTPSNKFLMEAHPQDSVSVAGAFLKHARLVAYNPALYRSAMGDDATTDALHTAVGDFFAFARLAGMAVVRELLRAGELELAPNAAARRAAAGSAEAALLGDANAQTRADAATAIIAELMGVSRSRSYAPDKDTRIAYGLAASRAVDFVLYDGSQLADEFGYERRDDGTQVFRSRYVNSSAINRTSPYGALVTEQASAAARAVQSIAALYLEDTKNYIGKAMNGTSRDNPRVDVVLGAH